MPRKREQVILRVQIPKMSIPIELDKTAIGQALVDNLYDVITESISSAFSNKDQRIDKLYDEAVVGLFDDPKVRKMAIRMIRERLQ